MGREVFGSKQETVVYATSNWQCNAHGCKLPGGMSQGFGQDARYYCRFHYGKKPSENDLITYVLREYEPLFEEIYAIEKKEDVMRISPYMEKTGRNDLVAEPSEYELHHIYKNKLLIGLGKEIAKKIQEHKSKE